MTVKANYERVEKKSRRKGKQIKRKERKGEEENNNLKNKPT